jgi:hypothetical protein
LPQNGGPLGALAKRRLSHYQRAQIRR